MRYSIVLSMILFLLSNNYNHVFGKIIDSTHTSVKFTTDLSNRIKESEIMSLDSINVSKNEIEIRLWIDNVAAYEDAEGYILHKKDSLWIGTHIMPISYCLSSIGKFLNYSFGINICRRAKDCKLVAKHGWEKFWSGLKDNNILALPDESELDLDYGIIDGELYIVEIKIGDSYRMYSYSNPAYGNTPEQKKMIKIIKLFREELVPATK